MARSLPFDSSMTYAETETLPMSGNREQPPFELEGYGVTCEMVARLLRSRGEVVLLLPEMSRERALACVARIVGGELGRGILCGVAAQSLSGTTTEEVLAAARRAANHATSAEPVAVAPEPDAAADSFRQRIARFERQLIVDALESTAGNQTKAARLLRMPLRTLVYKLRAYGLRAEASS